MADLRAFDSHLHLTDPRFDADRAEVLRRARGAGVEGMVTVATDPADARAAIALAAREAGVWATAGLHPHEADRWSAEVKGEVAELLEAPEVVAVGETGLDYHREIASRRVQRDCFVAQMALAEEAGLPAVVHSRDADADTAAVIREFAGRVRGILHCFTGGDALLEEGIAAGWYVSFSGVVTFSEEIAGRAGKVPAERLLIETDSPYLAPVPRRGRRNEPSFVLHTCERVAGIRGAEVEAVADLTWRNARAAYRLGEP